MPPKGLTNAELVDWYCMYVPSTVGLAACLYMLATYALFKRIRTPAVNLVMLQTVAETIFTLSHIVAFYNPPATGTHLCRFQGWLINFGIISSILFTASIAGYMHATLRRTRKQVELNAKNLAILSACVFSFAALCGALPLITDQYVDLGPRCWIAEDEEGRDRNAGVAFRFTSHYAVIWAANMYIFVCYYDVIKYLRENSAERAQRGDYTQIKRTIRILVYYPSVMSSALHVVICFCVWLPFVVMRLTTAIKRDPTLPKEALGFAHVFLSGEGLLYAIAFSQYRTVREEWTRFIFGGDAVSTTIPLTAGQASSDGNGEGVKGKIRVPSALTATEKILSSGFDVTTIDDLAPDVYEGDIECELELRNTETRQSTN